jgi:hypothetical protein
MFEEVLQGNMDIRPSLEKCSTYGMGTIDYKRGSHIQKEYPFNMDWHICVDIFVFDNKSSIATLALGSRLRQGLVKVRANNEPMSHISCSQECKRMWGNEPPHSQMSFCFGNYSPNGLLNFLRAIARSKLTGLKSSLYHWKALGM